MRSGEQSPGASMTREEKFRIGRQFERIKVDVIEVGFPASSNGNFEAMKARPTQTRTRRSQVVAEKMTGW